MARETAAGTFRWRASLSTSRSEPSLRWKRERRGRTVHSDSDEHVRLVVRTLGIDEAAWAETLDRYTAGVADDANVSERLSALASAFEPASRHLAPLPRAVPSACPACHALALTP